jgi:hypothetical protein
MGNVTLVRPPASLCIFLVVVVQKEGGLRVAASLRQVHGTSWMGWWDATDRVFGLRPRQVEVVISQHATRAAPKFAFITFDCDEAADRAKACDPGHVRVLVAPSFPRLAATPLELMRSVCLCGGFGCMQFTIFGTELVIKERLDRRTDGPMRGRGYASHRHSTVPPTAPAKRSSGGPSSCCMGIVLVIVGVDVAAAAAGGAAGLVLVPSVRLNAKNVRIEGCPDERHLRSPPHVSSNPAGHTCSCNTVT